MEEAPSNVVRNGQIEWYDLQGAQLRRDEVVYHGASDTNARKSGVWGGHPAYTWLLFRYGVPPDRNTVDQFPPGTLWYWWRCYQANDGAFGAFQWHAFLTQDQKIFDHPDLQKPAVPKLVG